jgi:hypothetical protein
MSTTTIADADLNATLEAIARRHLGVPTLRTRNSDGLDFHGVSAAGLRSATPERRPVAQPAIC